MKRLNLAKLVAVSLIAASFFSCKSTPDLNPVDPFELLDSDSSMYLTIPVQANQEFVTAAIQKIARVAEKDALKISDRLDMAYIAIDSNGSLQLSSSGNIPTTFVGMALSEKNGWKTGVKEGQVFYNHQLTGFELCIPSSSNVFLSTDIEKMARRYNKIAYSSFPDEKLQKAKNAETIRAYKESSEKIMSETLSDYNYNFLHENISSSMLLYSPNPRSFIRKFLGNVELKTPISSIYAYITPYSEVKGYDYNVKLILNLSDERTVKATEAILKVGLFGMAAKISRTGEKQITIVELLLKKNQMLALVR